MIVTWARCPMARRMQRPVDSAANRDCGTLELGAAACVLGDLLEHPTLARERSEAFTH